MSTLKKLAPSAIAVLAVLLVPAMAFAADEGVQEGAPVEAGRRSCTGCLPRASSQDAAASRRRHLGRGTLRVPACGGREAGTATTVPP